MISEEADEITPPLQKSNYSLDFHHGNNENISKRAVEQNIKGFVDGCVRSSLHDISHVNRESDSKCIEIQISRFFLNQINSTRYC